MSGLSFLSGARAKRPADAREAALWWSTRRRLGLTDAADEAAFRTWLARPGHAALFAEADDPVEALGDIAADDDIRAMREAALAATPARLGGSRLGGSRLGRGAIAAAIGGFALVMLGVAISLFQNRPAPSATLGGGDVPAVAPGTRYETAIGQRSDIPLPDGSVVTLNTNSLIEVAYSAQIRAVHLLRGQAMFQVAKGQPRPFVVTAGDRRITATGTAFDVRLDGAQVKVVLIEGHVNVTPAAPNVLDRVFPVLDRQQMAPGEALDATSAGPVSIAAADVDQATSWQRGQLVFHDETLTDAVAEMNRYTTRPIVIGDPRVGSLRISGVFGTARPENFVAAISAALPVDADTTTSSIQLSWRG